MPTTTGTSPTKTPPQPRPAGRCHPHIGTHNASLIGTFSAGQHAAKSVSLRSSATGGNGSSGPPPCLAPGKMSGRAGRAKREPGCEPKEGPQADHSRAATPGQATGPPLNALASCGGNDRSRSTGLPQISRRRKLARRAAPGRPVRAARPAQSAAGHGAAQRRRLIQYGSIRQWSCVPESVLSREMLDVTVPAHGLQVAVIWLFSQRQQGGVSEEAAVLEIERLAPFANRYCSVAIWTAPTTLCAADRRDRPSAGSWAAWVELSRLPAKCAHLLPARATGRRTDDRTAPDPG